TLTGLGVDDPDANFYENFACGSPRNYSFYCSELVMKMLDQQSMELNPAKRLAQVIAIQKQLEQDAARPTLDVRLDYFTVWPHVRGLVAHHNIFNCGRRRGGWRQGGGGGRAFSRPTPRRPARSCRRRSWRSRPA